MPLQQSLPEFEDHYPDRAELHISGNAGPDRALELGEKLAVIAVLKVTAVEHKTKQDKDTGDLDVIRSHKAQVRDLVMVPIQVVKQILEDARLADSGQPRLDLDDLDDLDAD